MAHDLSFRPDFFFFLDFLSSASGLFDGRMSVTTIDTTVVVWTTIEFTHDPRYVICMKIMHCEIVHFKRNAELSFIAVYVTQYSTFVVLLMVILR